MNDLLPGQPGQPGPEPLLDIERWQHLEAAFHRRCALHGFQEVRTPLCEQLELFQRGVGEGTDIVEKEMYTFEDRGQRRLALRPEGTASAVRAALEHKVLTREPVVRWYYLGPMFRAERPAKGRYRQFHQVGAETYGDPSPAADAEVIALAVAFLHELGITRFSVRLNSLGTAASRAQYRAALVEHFRPHRETLSPESQSRLERNPLRILDSKDPRDQSPKAGAPSVLDALTDDDRAHFAAVQAYLQALEVPFVVDPTLVRGLDYYTRTVFEIVDTSGALGAQDALGGGGRYDALFSELGSAGPVPAIGFALGIERLLLAAPQRDRPKPLRVAVVAAARADDLRVTAAVLGLARDLRARGVEALVDTRFGSMKSQMRRASDLAVEYALIVGGNEVDAGLVMVKDMAASTQLPEDRAELLERLGGLQRARAASAAGATL